MHFFFYTWHNICEVISEPVKRKFCSGVYAEYARHSRVSALCSGAFLKTCYVTRKLEEMMSNVFVVVRHKSAFPSINTLSFPALTEVSVDLFGPLFCQNDSSL